MTYKMKDAPRGANQKLHDKYNAVLNTMQPNTHHWRLLHWFLNYQKNSADAGITQKEAHYELGNTRLSATVWVLRHKYSIPVKDYTKGEPNRYGEQTHFKVYYLEV